MASIDDIFKGAGIPSKRKLDPVRDPTEIYKSAKLASHTRRHQPQVEDSPDVEAGPAPPPDEDPEDPEEDYGPSLPDDPETGDDAEGRFFGGGITAQEAEILDFVNDSSTTPATAPVDDKIDTTWLKKTALSFEKKITRNAELRARFENEPAKFIDSEADLDSAIKALSILSEHADLYPEFARLGSAASLVSLLAHENTDIAIDAVEIIGELTDEDVQATEEQWGGLVDALLEADLLGLLVSNFGRLDETQEADRAGVYHALGVVENLCSRSDTAETVGKDEELLRWLLERAGKSEKPVSQNKQYAAEILAILVQSSAANRRRLAGLNAVDEMLQLVAAYRKRDPEKGGDEEEYMENLFEALTCIVDEAEGKVKFVDAEGVELCLIMLKEGKLSKAASLRLLDHAAGGPSGAGVCQKLVDAGGLKTIFTMFMKKHDAQTTEHLVGIFASMLRLLPADSAERIRTLAKFVEKDYEKTEKLVKLRREYGARVGAVDAQIQQEQKGMDDDEKEEAADDWFSRRLDAGLFCLQTIDVILAWLVAEDGGAKKKIQELLADRDETFAVIKATIQEQIDGIETESEEGKDTREMLSTLAQFLA
ncbi:beta-catenin-like protein 1 [Podospora aff. communis PSN243]|uniref:Beta-catenin-like protein 1 n=1 Tax=Podospora aff. communis PSN243 TaxID=3040156 RepID=A0AAV9G5R0_9PEZI|nr:beta-catenin-like protein 1 [Podospora aff. communis PSN243]